MNTLTAIHLNDRADSMRIYRLFDAGRSLFSEGMYLQALDSFKLSLSMGETILGTEHPYLRNLNNAIGIAYRNLGDFDKSLQHFLKTEELYLSESKQNQPAVARIYNNIGNLYLSRLNYGMALDYYQRALDIFMSQPEKDLSGIADFSYNIANVYYNQSNYLKVIELAEKHLSQADADTKLMFLSLVAASYKELHKTEKAFESYLKTINYASKIYNESDIRVIFEYINFTNFLVSVNDFEKSRDYLKRIENLFSERGDGDGIFLALYFKACGLFYRNLIVESKNLDEFRRQKSSNLHNAIIYYEKGLEALGLPKITVSDISVSIENTHSLTQSIELLSLIADTYIQVADVNSEFKPAEELASIHKALDFYITTSDMIQQARREMHSDENKIQLGMMNEATFHKIVRSAYRAFRLEPDRGFIDLAFIHAERMKASAVYDHLSDQFARENSLVPDSLKQLERTLNYRITAQNEKLFNLKRAEFVDIKEIAEKDSLIFHLKKQRDELNQFLEKNYRDYYDLKYSGKATYPGEVQDNLKNNEILLEYVFDETGPTPELYSFCISKNSIHFHRAEIDSFFTGFLENTYRFMASPDFLFTSNDRSRQFCAEAYQLYRQLLSPFADIIRNKKIIIVPDGKLNYLPFDGLLTAMPDTSGIVQFNHLPYLIFDNTVHYTYSAKLMFSLSRQRKRAKNRLLAFAPAYKFDTVKVENEEFILAPLPGIQREVELISKLISGQTFSGEGATELNFRQTCEDHDILHLAMHAFINDSLPAFSRFAFSQNEGTSPEDDGWLNTSDIYNLRFNARLAVLSACNTGSGGLKRGEGVMSLARGFLYAGCPALVMTLWDVEDDAAARIMYSFYKNLKKGRPTDKSLRSAKLSYLENANARMAHPHYWLGYLSVGNDHSLFASYDLYFFLVLFFALSGIAADQFIRAGNDKKKK